ncbi:MAG: putative Glycosyl transferase, family 9 [Candidatus Binatus sp.]|nr:putative Glycosyl transferase, family 9 [Candidatus Binatus sp.]
MPPRSDRVIAMNTEADARIASERVLVIFPGAIGDLICVMPSIDAIARRHRGAAIELMARGELARFAVGRTVLTRGHSIDRPEVSALFAESSEVNERARELFGQFNRIYCFFAFEDDCLRKRLHEATDGIGSFHRFRPEGAGHVAAGYLASIGEPDCPIRVRIEPTVEDIEAARRVIGSIGDGSKLAVIFPGSGSPAKNWPAEKFADLTQALAAQTAVAIVIGPAEKSIARIFRANRISKVTVIENVELGTVAGLARLASVFIGNDSGMSHLAAAVGTRGVALFGPTDPARWSPIGEVEMLRREPIGSIAGEEVAAAVKRAIAI